MKGKQTKRGKLSRINVDSRERIALSKHMLTYVIVAYERALTKIVRANERALTKIRTTYNKYLLDLSDIECAFIAIYQITLTMDL